ncbi:MAG TPA: pre-peptidase C-terminal domain-containing protein [Actinomycetota bacterium]|nr:pre-peptidase C-terminal domain-containing protein [Actinomycetota bacterium]
MIRRAFFVLPFAALVVALLVPASQAAEQVTAPTNVGQTVTYSWEGTAPSGVNQGACTDLGGNAQQVDLLVPAGTYDNVLVLSNASITSGGADLKLTVIEPDGSLKTADAASAGSNETLSLSNPEPGRYTFIACMNGGPSEQAFSGTLTMKASARPARAPAPCSKPATAMKFTVPSYVDLERAGGEPSVFALPNGRLLYGAHAGTTHFYTPEAADGNTSAFVENYRGQTYYWYSDDRGMTWNFVDRTLPPNIPGSGFSDPDFAIDSAGNIYVSEINLLNVAVSKSTDNGSSYELQNFFGMTMTDRQWKAAGPENVLFMVGNAFAGGTFPSDPAGHVGHTIYRSTDGGKTFSPGVQDGNGLGDIVFDQRNKTLYEAYYGGGRNNPEPLQIAAFRNPLAEDHAAALDPEVFTIAEDVAMLSHWPAIDVDSRGNVYIVWDESGDGPREAGVWYSYSKNRGATWAPPIRVDRTDATDIWPWIAVGDPGRVAISWFGNDNKLPAHDAEQADEQNDPWNVYVAQTLNGLGCSKSRTTSGFRVAKATPQPFHVGTVCMGGTICQAELIDRRLGDYFTIDIDKAGRVVAAYSDTRQGGAVALPAFFRQTRGPSFNR